MKALLVLVFFFGTFSMAQAQRLCGTTEYVQQLIKANPALKNSYNKVQQQTSSLIYRPDGSQSRDTIPNQVITIPIVIHVLYNTSDQNISDAQIMSQLVVLNQDYRRQNGDTSLTPGPFKKFAADAKITFCLAQVDPTGKRTTGIIRKFTNNGLFLTDDAMKYSAQGGDDAWDCTEYLNIWVCNLTGRSLGYATPPGGPADRDGVVIGFNVFGTVGANLRYPFNKGRTATHEIGHWLGLIHIWGDAECGDDQVDDTPQQETYNFGCNSFPHTSTCSPNANGDMFMNFMDFSDDACMNMFTAGQVKRMRALFATGGIRNSFLTSFQCDSTLVQAGPLPVTTTTPPADTIIAQVIKVYPNPVHAQLTIEGNKISKIAPKTLHIFNSLGIQLMSKELAQSKTTLNLTGFVSGVYIIQVADGSSSFTTKIMVD